MDISMDIHRKPVDMDMDMDGKFHIHGKPVLQFINISLRMLTHPLLYHCQDSVLNRTEVRYYDKKPQVWCYDEVQHLATKQLDGCAHTLCWRTV